jgi:predicted dehydrogenase
MAVETVKIGIVGAGYWGQKLLAKFLAAPLAQVKVVCDIHEGNRAEIERKFPTVPTTDSLNALLDAPEIDAIVIVTPPATHHSLAEKALRAGKHIWVEKPLALKLAEGRRLVQLAREQKKVIFVDHTFLYDSAVRLIREMIQKKEMGDVYHLFLQRLNLGRIKRDSNVWWNSAPHDASIALYLLSSRPSSVSLHGYRYLQPNLEDLNMAIIEMSDGASAFVYHNWLYPENTAKLTVVGSKQFLVYEGKFEKRSITVYEYEVDYPANDGRPADKLPTTIPSKMKTEHKLEGFQGQEPLAAAVDDFIDSILNQREPVQRRFFSERAGRS